MADVPGQAVDVLDVAAGTLSGKPGQHVSDLIDSAAGTLRSLSGQFVDLDPDDLNPYIPPTPPDVADGTILSVEMLSSSSMLLTFDREMKNEAALQDTNSYTITAAGSGRAVNVTDVLVSNDDATDEVVIVFSEPTVGEQYTITALESLQGADEHTLDPTDNFKYFETRETKMNGFLNHLPLMFSRNLRTSMGVLLQALAREDDKIGGSRDDRLD